MRIVVFGASSSSSAAWEKRGESIRALSEKTVEAHVRGIFTRLGPVPAPDENRRVLALLAFLRSA